MPVTPGSCAHCATLFSPSSTLVTFVESRLHGVSKPPEVTMRDFCGVPCLLAWFFEHGYIPRNGFVATPPKARADGRTRSRAEIHTERVLDEHLKRDDAAAQLEATDRAIDALFDSVGILRRRDS